MINVGSLSSSFFAPLLHTGPTFPTSHGLDLNTVLRVGNNSLPLQPLKHSLIYFLFIFLCVFISRNVNTISISPTCKHAHTCALSLTHTPPSDQLGRESFQAKQHSREPLNWCWRGSGHCLHLIIMLGNFPS